MMEMSKHCQHWKSQKSFAHLKPANMWYKLSPPCLFSQWTCPTLWLDIPEADKRTITRSLLPTYFRYTIKNLVKNRLHKTKQTFYTKSHHFTFMTIANQRAGSILVWTPIGWTRDTSSNFQMISLADCMVCKWHERCSAQLTACTIKPLFTVNRYGHV